MERLVFSPRVSDSVAARSNVRSDVAPESSAYEFAARSADELRLVPSLARKSDHYLRGFLKFLRARKISVISAGSASALKADFEEERQARRMLRTQKIKSDSFKFSIAGPEDLCGFEPLQDKSSSYLESFFVFLASRQKPEAQKTFVISASELKATAAIFEATKLSANKFSTRIRKHVRQPANILKSLLLEQPDNLQRTKLLISALEGNVEETLDLLSRGADFDYTVSLANGSKRKGQDGRIHDVAQDLALAAQKFLSSPPDQTVEGLGRADRFMNEGLLPAFPGLSLHVSERPSHGLNLIRIAVDRYERLKSPELLRAVCAWAAARGRCGQKIRTLDEPLDSNTLPLTCAMNAKDAQLVFDMIDAGASLDWRGPPRDSNIRPMRPVLQLLQCAAEAFEPKDLDHALDIVTEFLELQLRQDPYNFELLVFTFLFREQPEGVAEALSKLFPRLSAMVNRLDLRSTVWLTQVGMDFLGICESGSFADTYVSSKMITDRLVVLLREYLQTATPQDFFKNFLASPLRNTSRDIKMMYLESLLAVVPAAAAAEALPVDFFKTWDDEVRSRTLQMSMAARSKQQFDQEWFVKNWKVTRYFSLKYPSESRRCLGDALNALDHLREKRIKLVVEQFQIHDLDDFESNVVHLIIKEEPWREAIAQRRLDLSLMETLEKPVPFDVKSRHAK